MLGLVYEFCLKNVNSARSVLILLCPDIVYMEKFDYSDNQVFAWGNNAMGQCGQGHSYSPITRPRKVVGLEGISLHQISAGTSHSAAWTALPTDRWDI